MDNLSIPSAALATGAALVTLNLEQTSFFSWFWSYYLTPALIFYPFLCATLRYQRIKWMQSTWNYGTRENPSFEEMTVKEAFQIMKCISDLEFPALFMKGLQFALFRTYGIPTISELLVKTTQLSTKKNVAKRYADTTVLLSDMYSAEPSSARSSEAYARLNYLHGHYIKQGKISNDDMLYTLSLFMNQPVEWIDRYEWRMLTDLERCAMGVYHKYMGEGMDISFDPLPGSKTGWKDGLHFYDELTAWAKDYEKRCMVPTKLNYDTAVQTRSYLLISKPKFTHGVLTKLVSAALDERLREAIMFEKAPAMYKIGLDAFMSLRRFCMRHLALPRPWFMRNVMVSQEPDKLGRRYFVQWEMCPVYVKPTLWNQYGPGAWMARMIGVPVPGASGMCPEGFDPKNAGPKAFVGKGHKEMEANKEMLMMRPTGCPFAMKR